MKQAVAIVVLFYFAVAQASTLTPCQEDRARRLNSTEQTTDSPLLHLIPECDENGDYAAKQCFTQKEWCICYRRNGKNINTPSKNLKSCDCIRDRDDALTAGGVGNYVPRCSRDGYYQKKQCLKDECWCVDKDGNSLTDPQTGNVKCD